MIFGCARNSKLDARSHLLYRMNSINCGVRPPVCLSVPVSVLLTAQTRLTLSQRLNLGGSLSLSSRFFSFSLPLPADAYLRATTVTFARTANADSTDRATDSSQGKRRPTGRRYQLAGQFATQLSPTLLDLVRSARPHDDRFRTTPKYVLYSIDRRGERAPCSS